jgi:hypothetical protein
MSKLVISDEFSHMGGKEFIFQRYPQLANEIKEVITTTVILSKSKVSREKTRKGRLVWSGKDFNTPLKKAFKDAGWQKEKIDLEHGSVEVDFYKEKVAVEVQFGKYSFVDTDFMKFEIFHYQGKIEAAVEILPSRNLRSDMYTGPPDFDQVIARIKARGRNTPAVPLWVIAVDCVV